jgi:hypothetical protein
MFITQQKKITGISLWALPVCRYSRCLLLLGSIALSSSLQATITLTEITAPTFGLILSGASGRQFVLNTSGTITGADAADHVSSQAAGDITVTDDTSPATIEILADNISTSGGLTLNQVLCSYAGGAQTQCDGSPLVATSSASASLKIGVDITTSQVHNGGDGASVSMDINVTYQ